MSLDRRPGRGRPARGALGRSVRSGLALVLAALLLPALVPALARAQLSVDARTEALEELSAEARRAVTRIDSALLVRTRPIPGGRAEVGTGIVRADYRPVFPADPSSDPETAARRYLSDHAARFGLEPDLEGLRLARTRRSPAGFHLVFEQRIDGVPVFKSTLKVNLDRNRRPISVLNGLKLDARTPAASTAASPSLTAREARDRVAAAVSARGAVTTEARLVVYPSDPPRPAWRLVAWPEETPAAWLFLVDARDGRFLRGYDTRARHGPSAPPGSDPAQTTGSGLVFLPDPLTSSGRGYGDDYVDADDADRPALNGERFVGTLHGLTRRGGRYYLESPLVRIADSVEGRSFGLPYQEPSESHPDSFRYGRGDDRFEAVNAYYHAYRGLQRAHTVSEAFAGRPQPVLTVNPHGEGDYDNSFYDPNRHGITFGEGGVDDAEDGGVVWHELGHALLERGAPGLLANPVWSEERAFHEGWSDYWTVSFRESLRDRFEHAFDAREVFPWDSGNGQIWPGRRVAHTGTYPASLTRENIYVDGLLWAATAANILGDLRARHGPVQGRTVSDRLHLQSHLFLEASSFTMGDAGVALLLADRQLYDGVHHPMLLERLGARGFVDPTQFGPEIAFDPSVDAQVANGRLQIGAEIRPRAFGVESASVLVRPLTGEGPYERVNLARTSGDRFTGSAPIGVDAGLLAFYVEARDSVGVAQRVPRDGSDRPFFLPVGTSDEEDALAGARPSGGWYRDSTAWAIDGTDRSLARQESAPRAGLVLTPVRVAADANAQSYFVLTHRFRGPEGSAAGNLELSADGGRTWQVIEPLGGYPSPSSASDPLPGEPNFAPEPDGDVRQHLYDLRPWAGRYVRLRLDLAAEDRLASGDEWTVLRGRAIQTTSAPDLALDRSLSVQANFPEPVRGTSTAHFTLPEAGRVTVTVYNLLGRRVAVLLDADRSAGTHGVTFGRSAWAAGTYFLRIRFRDRQVTEPFTVVR